MKTPRKDRRTLPNILPDLHELTGLSEAELESALEELSRKGFIQLKRSQGSNETVGISLCNLDLI
jgi:predicted transcriptional regulator